MADTARALRVRSHAAGPRPRKGPRGPRLSRIIHQKTPFLPPFPDLNPPPPIRRGAGGQGPGKKKVCAGEGALGTWAKTAGAMRPRISVHTSLTSVVAHTMAPPVSRLRPVPLFVEGVDQDGPFGGDGCGAGDDVAQAGCQGAFDGWEPLFQTPPSPALEGSDVRQPERVWEGLGTGVWGLPPRI